MAVLRVDGILRHITPSGCTDPTAHVLGKETGSFLVPTPFSGYVLITFNRGVHYNTLNTDRNIICYV